MKVIIPAKKSSSRVVDKNWRPFFGNKSLVDIKIEQLLKVISPNDIYLSCEDESKQSVAQKYGINFLLRRDVYASDDTSWPDAIWGIIKDTSFEDEEEIAWVEVINPLFDDYGSLFKAWNENKRHHDSLVLVSAINKYLITQKGSPMNFQYGKWHAMSQNMEPLYAWDSVCIIRKKDLLYFSYPIGKTPYVFTTALQCVDIDTMEDFEFAQYFYSKKYTNEN